MTCPRRSLLLIGACALALAACGGEPAAPVVTANITASPGMNPGPDGADRPVTVSLLQLSGASAFETADIFALQDPAAALGADLVKADQVVLAPGASATATLTMQPTTTVIGITAGFRDPGGKTVRKAVPAPATDATLAIGVGPSGLTVTGP